MITNVTGNVNICHNHAMSLQFEPTINSNTFTHNEICINRYVGYTYVYIAFFVIVVCKYSIYAYIASYLIW